MANEEFRATNRVFEEEVVGRGDLVPVREERAVGDVPRQEVGGHVE